MQLDDLMKTIDELEQKLLSLPPNHRGAFLGSFAGALAANVDRDVAVRCMVTAERTYKLAKRVSGMPGRANGDSN